MPKNTNEDEILSKLEYIGLDLENIPDFLKEQKNIDYRPIRSQEENTYRVYKYLPISKIQILLTPTNRLNTIKEKYSKASSLITYLNPEDENDIIKHTTFLKMLNEVKTEDIEKIDEEQKALNKAIPFKVKFEENYMWQIYYSDLQGIYFMLVPTEDLEYASFFYLLKKQIEYYKKGKDEMIFAPICYENYSEKYFKKSEISDLEKYLWFFTKNWPNIYEVYNKKEELSIQIVGQTAVYEGICSDYKIRLENKEEAIKFYKLLKALFILETELPHHYDFIVKINQYGSPEFIYENKKITYDNMLLILNNQYIKAKEEIIKLEEKKTTLKQELQNLKIVEENKTKEYLAKEKQIATYLEYKKTFFGRMRYFFKYKKMKKNKVQEVYNEEESIKVDKTKYNETNKDLDTQFIKKEYYTIDDIVKIYKELDIIKNYVNNIEMDESALINKIESLERKIKNANLYIEEIDKHEKSIFEFWKFANKDESLMLNEGFKQEEVSNNKIEKVYSYEDDLEEIGILVDKAQRDFTQQEKDSIYIATTEQLYALNNIEDEKILEESLEKLKEEAENQRILFDTEKIDIFGGTQDDSTKIKMLANKKHREVAKDKLKILDINSNTTIQEYKERLQKIHSTIVKCINNVKTSIAIPVYMQSEKEDLNGLKVFNLNAEEEINGIDEKEIDLYRINAKQKDKIIYFSNCIYYDNFNKTLPIGMDVATKCLLNLEKLKLKKIKKEDFRVVKQIDEFKITTKKINIYEYKILEENNDK